MICKHCGYNNEGNSRFCVNCGGDLAGSPAQGNVTPPTPSYTQPNYQQPNYQSNGYQSNGYQSNGYQPNGYQPNGYQSNGYQPNGYQQPGYNPYGGYTPSGITRREIVTCILLSIITCGIYGLYWLSCLADDLNKVSAEPQPTSGGTVVLLSIVTCNIYLFVWLNRAGSQLCRARQMRTGYPGENNGVLYIVLALLTGGIVPYCMIQSELNKLV